MWNPALRATQNERATNPPTSVQTQITDEQNNQLASTLMKHDQPPFFIMITRINASTVHLTNALTDEVIYKVRDTGRGSLSSKPDFEFFRATVSDMFVGSIRIGKRSNEVKFPLTQAKFGEVEKFKSRHLPGEMGELEWKLTKIEKHRRPPKAEQSTGIPEVVVVDCVSNGKDNEPVCTVKLYAPTPMGRIEIWVKEACVDIGGDWNTLDELVVLTYANMELARRKVLSLGSDKTGSAAFTMMAMPAMGT